MPQRFAGAGGEDAQPAVGALRDGCEERGGRVERERRGVCCVDRVDAEDIRDGFEARGAGSAADRVYDRALARCAIGERGDVFVVEVRVAALRR